MPQRIQRRRTKGWRTPEGAIYVGRGSKWGNPFRIVPAPPFWEGAEWLVVDADDCPIEDATTQEGARRKAVDLYRDAIADGRIQPGGDPWFTSDGGLLRGKDLMCWCPLDSPCHADVLLELANPPSEEA